MGLERIKNAKVHLLVRLEGTCTICGKIVQITLASDDYEMWCNGAPERYLNVTVKERYFMRNGKCQIHR